MKNTLKSDILYLNEDYSFFNHIFVSFLPLYGYCKIENMLREKSLLDKNSPMDIFEEYSQVYIIEDENNKIITEIPKKVKQLDDKLNTNVFSKNRS